MVRGMSDQWKQNLRNALKAKGMKMHQLARSLGRNDHYISQLLTRDHVPTIGTIQEIATVLGVSVNDIIEGPDSSFDAVILARKLSALTPAQRDAVMRMIDSLRESGDKLQD